MTTTKIAPAAAPDNHLTYVYGPVSRTWTVRCDSDICEGRELEVGYLRLDWAVEEQGGHDCEEAAEAAYDRRMDNGWSVAL